MGNAAEKQHFETYEAVASARDLHTALANLYQSAMGYLEDDKAWLSCMREDLEHARRTLKIHKQYEAK